MLIVIGSYYVLFEVMGGTTRALIIESSVMTAFLIVAVAGFKRNRTRGPWRVRFLPRRHRDKCACARMVARFLSGV